MKKLITISAIVLSGLAYNTTNAQIRIGISLPHITIVPRPVVAVRTQAPVYQEPAVSDDCDFYYLPDVGAYYSVAEQCYYYQDGDRWISAAYLPGVYHDFDWRYAARRFEIHENRPYLRNDFYRGRYQGFDRNIARYHNDFRGGFDYRHNGYAYNNDHHFDNRGGFGQHFDNNRDNGDNHGQSTYGHNNGGYNRDNNQNRDNNNRQNGQPKNHNKGDRDNQRLAQNNNGFNHGHNKEHF